MHSNVFIVILYQKRIAGSIYHCITRMLLKNGLMPGYYPIAVKMLLIFSRMHTNCNIYHASYFVKII